MNKIAEFITGNIRTIGVIYLIGAVIVFIGVLLFFWLIAKAEDNERELYPDDYYYSDGEVHGFMTILLALIIAVFMAIVWAAIPLVLLGVWFYSTIADKFPHLMGSMADDLDDEETEENE